MPVYEFKCLDCETEYRDRVDSYDESGVWPDTKCQSCESYKKEKLISTFNFMFMQPEGTKRWSGDHDYRFKHNLPKVIKERQDAEMASRSGKTPYNSIDDLNTGSVDNFGEVK
jgi:putative FmdB family regulatory protein